jgi:hypothetical protein
MSSANGPSSPANCIGFTRPAPIEACAFERAEDCPNPAHDSRLVMSNILRLTTTVASSSHETINPANIVQPRAFVIAETVAVLLTVASACTPSFPVRAGVPS